jgi:hypothetical protein
MELVHAFQKYPKNFSKRDNEGQAAFNLGISLEKNVSCHDFKWQRLKRNQKMMVKMGDGSDSIIRTENSQHPS